MCLAIPGKIVKVTEDKAVVDYGDNQKEVPSLIDVKVGDYVIVQVGRIVQKVEKEDALKSIRAWKSVQ
ncbi:MAG: HypC/HybG/HupF family hydrogenase formation chaperone [Nanoarchaeota archaeon]|nr:HypC/HybG/HupF family hydrogenase formation chaperone [Nanoarchaeota archaeon]